MILSGLFSSCAIPADKVPRAASFSDCRAALSRASRSVMSVMKAITRRPCAVPT